MPTRDQPDGSASRQAATDAGLVAEAVAVRRHARRLVSAAEAQAAIRRMAGDIAAKLAGRNPIIVAVMHGGMFTAVELCRHFEFPYELSYVHASRYHDRLTGGELEWQVAPRPHWAGRTLLLVDDILDQGVTLTALRRVLLRLGVGELFTAVFAVKELTRPAERPSVDFAAVAVEDRYVFGCGMDYKGYWRGLPELLAVDGGALEEPLS